MDCRHAAATLLIIGLSRNTSARPSPGREPSSTTLRMITPPSLPPACQGFEYSVALTTAVLTQRHLRIQSAQRHSARSDSLVFQRRMELRGAIENHLLDGAGFGEDHHNQPWVNSQR